MSLFPSEESQRLDAADPLASYRLRFSIPKMPDGTDTLYLCGNSLGLQSKDGIDALHAVVKDWAELGIEGYFTGDNPWVDYGTELRESEARLVGRKKTHQNGIIGG